MRQLYVDVLLRRLRAGDVLFPLRALRSLWGAVRGEARPLLGTLIVTYRCDLRCVMCDLPARGDRGAELDSQGIKGVLDGMADLGVLGVGITGGEPLLREDLPEICAYGTSRGLLMHVNTNGSLVTPALAQALSDAGVASVNVSLDGPEAQLHDELRRRTGSFRRVLRAVARLVAVRNRRYRVALTCALGQQNAPHADRLLERARDLGADRVGFLPVHDFPANGVAAQPEGIAVRPLLLDRAGSDPLLDNSRAYLGLFERAFAGQRNPLPCSAPRTSVVVDCYGDVYPCVPLNAAGPVRAVGRGDVRAVWRSNTHRRARRALRSCRACYWNCHTEMNIALRRWGARA